MIYSVHNAITGGFDYFEGGPDVPINDDLPTPRYGSQSKVGIAALSAGRPLPAGCRKVGAGALPVGSISSGRRGMWSGTQKGSALPSGLGSVPLLPPTSVIEQGAVVALGALAVAAGAISAVDRPQRQMGWVAASVLLAAWPVVHLLKKAKNYVSTSVGASPW